MVVVFGGPHVVLGAADEKEGRIVTLVAEVVEFGDEVFASSFSQAVHGDFF